MICYFKVLFACRLVKKLMRLRTCSSSGALRAVLDSESDLFAFRLCLTEEKAGHFPSPDDWVVYLHLTDNSRAGECDKMVSFQHRERGHHRGTTSVVIPTPTRYSRVD